MIFYSIRQQMIMKSILNGEVAGGIAVPTGAAASVVDVVAIEEHVSI